MQKVIVRPKLETKLEARFSSPESSRKAREIPKIVVPQVDITQPLRLLKMFARNHNYPLALLQNETLKQIAQAILDQLPDENLPPELEPLEPKVRSRGTQRKSKGPQETDRKRAAKNKK